MILFPYAKVNLGLQIISKPRGGKQAFHQVKTFMVPAGLHDILEVLPSQKKETRLFLSGIELPGEEENLCIRAYKTLDREVKTSNSKGLPPVDIYLHKNIPAGAGLGGGSSNAAFMLKALDSLFSLKLNPERLSELASLLGADCCFFLHGKSMISSGKGDTLHPHMVPELKKYSLVIITPPFQISTSWAYKNCSPGKHPLPLEETLPLPVDNWQEKLKNDFEPLIFSHYPVCERIKQRLIETGSTYASLSGSGSSVFGIYQSAPPLPELTRLFPDCLINITGTDVN